MLVLVEVGFDTGFPETGLFRKGKLVDMSVHGVLD